MKLNGIDHIVWDWNGTLFDDPHACVETLNVILKKRNISCIDIDAYRDVFRFPVREYYEILGIYLNDAEWDDLAVEFHTIYRDVASKTADNAVRLAAPTPRRGEERLISRGVDKTSLENDAS